MALEKAKGMTFTIQKKAVAIHYAHHGSFIPAYAPTQWTIDYGFDGQLAIYWDEQAFLSVYTSPSAASRTPTASSREYPIVYPIDILGYIRYRKLNRRISGREESPLISFFVCILFM